MADAVPTNANQFIEQQLNKRLTEIEQSFDSDALCIVGALINGVDDLIRITIENLRQHAVLRSGLAVVLTTNGGFIETVDRIVDTMRHHYKNISFIIPNFAFSAGTVLARSSPDLSVKWVPPGRGVA